MQVPRPAKNLPLFVPQRDYPRPAAKIWIDRASKLYSLDKPHNGGEPWLPLTAMEGLLVLGHFNEHAPLGDIPDPLTIKVKLRRRDYDALSQRCMEQLSRFMNSNPTFASAWESFEKQAVVAHVPSNLRGLQFAIEHGMTPRGTNSKQAKKYLDEHKDCAWLFKSIASRLPILPTEDLKPNELPSGRLPEEVVSKYKAVCYEVEEERLHVLVPASTNSTAFKTELKAQLEFTGEIELAYGDPDALARFVDNKVLQSVQPRDDIRLTSSDNQVFIIDPSLMGLKIKQLTDPIDILSWTLGQAITVGATDIAYEPHDVEQASIRLRINGRFTVFGFIPLKTHSAVISVAKSRAKCNQVVTKVPQDGKFRVRSGDRDADIRLSTLPVEKNGLPGEALALRVLGRVKFPSISALGMPDLQERQIKWVQTRKAGLFLVTGPTSHGKTTTLNCILKEMASPERAVLSIEDPVELPIQWVRQSAVNDHPEVNYTFATALKAFLRQNPDVLMIGEIRDEETAKIAFNASLTGHLVFATLHSNTALTALTRLKELKVDSSMVLQSMIGTQAQRLIRTVCPNCREEIKLPEMQREAMRRYCQRITDTLVKKPNCNDAQELINSLHALDFKDTTVRGQGCSACNNTGFDKQRAVMEMYIFQDDPDVLDMLDRGVGVGSLQKYYLSQGHLDLAGQMIRAFSRHETTFSEIESYLPRL